MVRLRRRFLFALALLVSLPLIEGARCRRVSASGQPVNRCAGTPGSARLLVVGLDGADWRMLDALVAAGFLPTIGGILAQSARGSLSCVPAWPSFPCYCPAVWTAIATGQPAVATARSSTPHGLKNTLDLTSDRLVPAIWTAADVYGLTSTLISLRHSFPPEPEATIVATEQGLDFAAGLVFDPWPWPPATSVQWNIGLDLTKPPTLFSDLATLSQSGVLLPAWTVFSRDRVAMEVLLRLAQAPAFPQTDLTLITIHGIDRAEHARWDTVQAVPDGPLDIAALVAQAAAWTGPLFSANSWPWNVASQYLETDAWLGRLLAAASYDYIVFVSDHGMGRNPDFGTSVPGGSLPGHHVAGIPEALTSVFSIAGPGVMPGATMTGDVLDVAPTLAYLLGIPVAENLPGRVKDAAFDPAHLEAFPICTTPSW